jgi:hypothetical protein
MGFTDEQKEQLWNLALSNEEGRKALFESLKGRFGDSMLPSQLYELEKVLVVDFDADAFEALIDDIFSEK